ncbi:MULTISPECIES: hypothetical protein, partial [unclassified Endozoicomonas]|uniref:hypothetical protein n=1 Tax=unclassified Endozoicomonas TaxID=2644528 RepID=UPI00214817E1
MTDLTNDSSFVKRFNHFWSLSLSFAVTIVFISAWCDEANRRCHAFAIEASFLSVLLMYEF